MPAPAFLSASRAKRYRVSGLEIGQKCLISMRPHTVQFLEVPRNGSVGRLAAGLLICITALVAVYVVATRVRRPPTPAAARLPSSARMLLQPFRTDTVSLTVAAQGELNYRVGMQAGATLVYAWAAAPQGQKLTCEFAGHPADGVSEAHSAFVAQSSGWYRWHWKNPNSRKVTIRLKLTGYYEPATLPSEVLP
jgi:hypothetical protein